MGYRGFGSYKSKVPKLRDLSSLSFVDLKKIKRAIEAYAVKIERRPSDQASLEARNENIRRQNHPISVQEEKWHSLRVEPLQAEMNRVNKMLSDCRVGYLAKFVTDSFEFNGGQYKAYPGKMLVQQRLELENKLEAVRRSKPAFNTLPMERMPKPPKGETSLKIGGATLKVIFSQIDIHKLNDLIKGHEQERENEKSKLIALQARAATSEGETRQLAQKFRRDLHKQLALVPVCPYCAGSLSDRNAHLDHIYPVSKGGKSNPMNLVFVCAKCNQGKTNLTLRTFLMRFGIAGSDVHHRLEVLSKDF